MPGKRADFSADENIVLREALRRLRVDRGLTQQALGKLLGMTQQNAYRLLAPTSTSPGGMGRGVANALAHELGYRDAEHYLIEVGISAAVDGSHGSDRGISVSVARKIGFDEAAIQAVVNRYEADEKASGRPLKWWITKFGDEERDRAADVPRPPVLPSTRKKSESASRGR